MNGKKQKAEMQNFFSEPKKNKNYFLVQENSSGTGFIWEISQFLNSDIFNLEHSHMFQSFRNKRNKPKQARESS